MKIYGVIMAGGGGTRFWPLSRKRNPKQLLNLSGNGIMINETIDRISKVISFDNIFIVCNINQSEKIYEAVKDNIDANHILKEPIARNTAACIGYAAVEITKKYGEGVMCIFPSDHYIKDLNGFNRTLKKAINAVENQEGKLITIGIVPTFAATGYGYIKFEENSETDVYTVNEFIEKPNLESAKGYLQNGNYAWNSGMFIWKTSTILLNFERFLPKLYDKLMMIKNAIGTKEEYEAVRKVYTEMPCISIDYGVMERSGDVIMLKGNFGWSDIGSWDALGSMFNIDEKGNIIKGEQINLDTKNCISYSENRFIATIGVENLIIVETEDAVLVCNKDDAQEVKHIVDILIEQDKDYLL